MCISDQQSSSTAKATTQPTCLVVMVTYRVLTTHDTFNTPGQVAVPYSTVQVAQHSTVHCTVPYPTTQPCTVQYNELVT